MRQVHQVETLKLLNSCMEKTTGLCLSVRAAFLMAWELCVYENRNCRLGIASARPARPTSTPEFSILAWIWTLSSVRIFLADNVHNSCILEVAFSNESLFDSPAAVVGKVNLWQYKPQGLHYGDGFRRAAPTRLGLEINKATAVCIFETECEEDLPNVCLSYVFIAAVFFFSLLVIKMLEGIELLV